MNISHNSSHFLDSNELRLHPRLHHANTAFISTAAEALGGYFLVWPIFVAVNTEFVPRQQREWLQGRLSHIGHTFGLNQAQVLLLARRHVLTCGPVFP